MMTTVKQILEQKGSAFHAVRPTDSVFDALSLMAQFDIGCVLVTENDKLVGIFTERDYARKVVLKGLVSRDVKVGDLMTHKPLHRGSVGHRRRRHGHHDRQALPPHPGGRRRQGARHRHHRRHGQIDRQPA